MCAQHPVKNGPEDDYLLVETCSPHITLCNNKYSCADVQFFSITLPTYTKAAILSQVVTIKLRLRIITVEKKTVLPRIYSSVSNTQPDGFFFFWPAR